MNAPQPPFTPQPGYNPQQQFAPAPRNGMGTTALVLGILAIVLAFIPIVGFVSYPLALLGIIFGLVGLRRVGKHIATNRGVALTGLIASVVGFVLVIIATVLWVGAISAGVQSVNESVNAVHNVTYQVSSTNGGPVTVTYSQGSGGTGSVASVPSPWSVDVPVTGSSAVLSASTSPDFQNPGKTDGLTCSIIDKDTGKTLVTNSVPASAIASVSCNTIELGR